LETVHAVWHRWQAILNKHGIKTWALGGTLLGLVRNGTIANVCNEGNSQPDIDVGAFVSDREKLAEGSPIAKEIIETLGAKILYRNKYDTTLIIDLSDGMYTDMYQARNHIAIEIWWYEREDDMYVYPVGGAGPFCHKYFDTLLTRSLTAGYVQTTMRVPTNPEGILEAAYGSDWESPYGSGKFYAHTDLGGCERFEGSPGGDLKATLAPALLGLLLLLGMAVIKSKAPFLCRRVCPATAGE
jgi:hypothetical protein